MKKAVCLILCLILLSSQPTQAWLYTVAGVIGAGVLSPVLLPTGLVGTGVVAVGGLLGGVAYKMMQTEEEKED